jgi:hypothetical protein
VVLAIIAVSLLPAVWEIVRARRRRGETPSAPPKPLDLS